MNWGIKLPLLGIYTLVSLVVAAKSPNPFTMGNLLVVGGIGGSAGSATVARNREQKITTDVRTQLIKELEGERTELANRERDLYESQRRLERETESLNRQIEGLVSERQKWQDNREQKWIESEKQLEREHFERMRVLDLRETNLLNQLGQLEREKEMIERERNGLDLALEEKAIQLQRENELIRLENEAIARQWVADALEPKNEEIACLQGELEEMRKQLSVATYPKLPGGRDRLAIQLQGVIPKLFELGFMVDYENHELTTTDDLVWLRARNYFDIKELTNKSGLIQSFFESPHIVSFEWAEKGLLLMRLKAPTEVKKKRSKPDERIRFDDKWINDLFNHSFHFRINGQTGGGKSCFVNNLLTIATSSIFDKSTITIGDPNHPLSPWIINGKSHIANYKTYEECVGMMEVMGDLVNQRIKVAADKFDRDGRDHSTFVPPDFTPSIWVVDEIDTLMSRYKKEIKPNLQSGIKTGRKYKVMVVYLGQSPLPDDIGLRHPDVDQSTAIHIGVNAPKAIDASKYIDRDRHSELMEEIRWLNDHGNRHYAFIECPGIAPFVALLPRPIEVMTSKPEHEEIIVGKTLDPLERVVSIPVESTLEPAIEPSESGKREQELLFELLRKRTPQYKIIEQVWGLKKGGYRAYQEKVELLKSIRQSV